MKLFKNLIKKFRSPHPFTETTIRWFHSNTTNPVLFLPLSAAFPLPGQIGFQSPGTPVMEGIIDFHHDLMFFLIYILGFVVWFLCAIGYSFYNRFPSTRDLNLLIYKHHINFIRVPYKQNHHLWLEIVWTVIPALILISIVLPSFALIYSMDEFLLRPRVTLKAVGNQWYWTYNYGCSLSAQASSTLKTTAVLKDDGVDPDDNVIKTSSGFARKTPVVKEIRDFFKRSLELYFRNRVLNNSIRTTLPPLAALDDHRNDNTRKIRNFEELYQLIINNNIEIAIAELMEDADTVQEIVNYRFTRFCLNNLRTSFGEPNFTSLRDAYDIIITMEHLCEKQLQKLECCLQAHLVTLDTLQQTINSNPERNPVFEKAYEYLVASCFETCLEYDQVKQAHEYHLSLLKDELLNAQGEWLNEIYPVFLYNCLIDEEALRSLYLFLLDDDGFIGYAIDFTLDDINFSPFNTMRKDELRVRLELSGCNATDEQLDEIFTLFSKSTTIPLSHHVALFELLSVVFIESGDTQADLETFLEYYEKLVLGFMCKEEGVKWDNNPIDAFNFSPSLQNHVYATALLSEYAEGNDFLPEEGASGGCAHTSCQVTEPESLEEGRRHFALKFDSYMLPADMLERGHLRLLEVDKRVVLPTRTGIRLLVSSYDVLHSWAVPAFGIKLDGCPGRLNQTFIYIKKEGLYYGQCSEICGVNHAFMPIVIKAIDPEEFSFWLLRRIEAFNALVEATDKYKLKMIFTDEPNIAKSDDVNSNSSNND